MRTAGIVALIEATPRHAGDGTPVTVRLCWNAVTRADFFGVQWYPGLVSLPTFETDLGFDGVKFGQGATPTAGPMVIAIDPVTAPLASLVWKNAPITLKTAPRPAIGDPADGDFTVAWAGRADKLSEADGLLTIVALDAGQPLTRPVQPVLFGSSGSALLDGADAVDKAGQPVPVGWGALSAVPAILVDKSYNIWLLLGRPASAVTSIEDGGAPLTLGVARASLADLRATAPAAGAADYCLNADGLVVCRPWTAPTYPLIADLTAAGGATAAGIASAIVAARSGLGFTAGTVAAFDAAMPATCQLYVADGKTVANALDLLFAPLGSFWKLNSAGTIDLGRFTRAAAATRDIGIIAGPVTRLATVMPTGRRTLGYATNNRVLGTNEIAKALTADNAAAIGGVPAATIAAEISDAAGAAATALSHIADLVADGILTPAKKSLLIRDADVLASGQAGLDAQAIAFGVTTEKTTYDTRIGALATYLGGLVAPSDFRDLTGNTTVVGADFRGYFAAAFDARDALLVALAAAAALWPNQSGYGLPANFADVTAAHIAAGITGQGALATASSVTAGQIAATIGGANLLDNSSFDIGTALYLGWGPYNNSGAAEPTAYSLVAGRRGGQAIQLSWGVRATTPKGIYLDNSNANVFRAGVTYTWSFYAASTAGWATLGKTLALAWNHAPSGGVAVANPPLSTLYQRYIFTFHWDAGATVDANGYLYVNSFDVAGGLLLIDDMQVEEGDVATAYSPLAPGNATALRYPDGATVTSLKPAQVGADVTGGNTAAAIAGQGPLATSALTPGQVANANISISAGGALAGGGGGTVTYGGLGGQALGLQPNLFFGSGLLLQFDGGPAATNANYFTASGTAAAIAGQSAWATTSAIGAPASVAGQVSRLDLTGYMQAGNIYLAGINNLGAVFPAQYGADKTSTQTAAAIAGQGTLATKSAAVWGSDFSGMPNWSTDLNAAGFGGFAYGPTIKADYVQYQGGAGKNLSAYFPATTAADQTSGATAAAITGQGGLATRGYVSLGDGNGMTDEAVTYWLTTPIVVTTAGTAAAIAGQGVLATRNRVVLQAAEGGLTNQANNTWLLDIHIITVQGTAAAIAGQGTLATANAVDYTTQVTGKPAATGGTITVALGAAVMHFVPNGGTVSATAAVGTVSSSAGGTIHATIMADGGVFATSAGSAYGPGEPAGEEITATFTNTGAARLISFTSGYTYSGGAPTIDPHQSFLTA